MKDGVFSVGVYFPVEDLKTFILALEQLFLETDLCNFRIFSSKN